MRRWSIFCPAALIILAWVPSGVESIVLSFCHGRTATTTTEYILRHNFHNRAGAEHLSFFFEWHIIHDPYIYCTYQEVNAVLSSHTITLGFFSGSVQVSAGISDSWLIFLSSSSFETPLFNAVISSSCAGPLPAHRMRQFSSNR